MVTFNEERAIAAAKGEVKYEAKWVCRKNPEHGNMRYTKDGNCMVCAQGRSAAYRTRALQGYYDSNTAQEERAGKARAEKNRGDNWPQVATWGGEYPNLMKHAK